MCSARLQERRSGFGEGQSGGSGRSPPPPSAEIPHPAALLCAEEGRPPPPRGLGGSNRNSAPNETPNPSIPVRLSEPLCGFWIPRASLCHPPPPPQTQPKKQNEAQMLKSAPGQSWFLLGEGNLFALVLPIPVSANAEGGSYERFAFMSRAGTSG